MVHINKADSHTSVSNLFISPQTEQSRRRSHPDCWPRPLGPLVWMKVVRGRVAVQHCAVYWVGRGFFFHTCVFCQCLELDHLSVNASIRLDGKNIYSNYLNHLSKRDYQRKKKKNVSRSLVLLSCLFHDDDDDDDENENQRGTWN